MEERTAELAVINSIQQGMAGSLDFHGVVELVGDKLRTVFGSDNLSIVWWDDRSATAQMLYAVQHGERVQSGPRKPDPNGPFMRAMFANRPVLINSRAEMDAWGMRPPEGLAPSLATLTVPIFASDKLLGAITLDSHDPARRFGEDDQRLLQTVAATMGIALENARLFDQTKEALHKVEERTAELTEALEYQTAISQVLRVISESPTDVAPVFEVILDCATRLVQPQTASIFRYDGRLIHMAATRNWTPEVTEQARALFPMPADERSIAGRAILARKTIAIEDISSDPQYGLTRRSPRRRLAHGQRADAEGRRAGGRHQRRLVRARPDATAPDRPAPDLRRPGRDRDRERAPVQRDQRSAGAADRDCGGA